MASTGLPGRTCLATAFPLAATGVRHCSKTPFAVDRGQDGTWVGEGSIALREQHYALGETSTRSWTTTAPTSTPKSGHGSVAIRGGPSTSLQPQLLARCRRRLLLDPHRQQLRRGAYNAIVDLQVAIKRYLRENEADPTPLICTKPAAEFVNKLLGCLHLLSDSARQ